jgi:hypothetical protein
MCETQRRAVQLRRRDINIALRNVLNLADTAVSVRTMTKVAAGLLDAFGLRDLATDKVGQRVEARLWLRFGDIA